MANMTFKASLLPNTDLGYSLGSEDKRWKINGYTLEDTYVKKSGDTMSGTLTITKSTDSEFIKLARTNLTKGTIPSENQWSGIYFIDSSLNLDMNGGRFGALQVKQEPNGNNNISLQAATNAIGSSVFNQLNLGISSTGTCYYSVSDPAAFRTALGLGARATDNTEYLPLTGGTMTGNIDRRMTNVDANKTNNNVSETQYPTTCQTTDVNGKILSRLETVVYSNGKIGGYWYCRNYNTSGTLIAQKGINMYLDKNGTMTYGIADAANFRSALGLGARATDNTAYLPLTGGTMTGAITMNKSAQQLIVPYNGTNYDVLHNHGNGNYSLSACGNGLYMGYYNTILMDWLSGKMSLSKTGNLALNNGLLQITNYNNTVYIGSQNADWCHFSSSKKFYFNQNVEIDGQYTQYAPAVISEWWISGRNSAAVRVANYNEYHAGLSMKTTNGSFEIGVYQNNTLWFTYCTDANYNANNNSVSQCHIDSSGHLWGAVWNDYAEMRNVPEANDYTAKSPSTKLAGRCVRDVGDGTMTLTTERLQRGGKIVSDTFGFNIGETEDCKTPIAVSGRALVYIHEGREVAAQHIGWPVGTGPDGTVSIMTEEEEEKYPSRIVGTISEIPTYETWGEKNININNRIWIYVK